jgi:hypothetical protein
MMGRTRREIIILRIPLKNLTYSHGFIRARLKTIVERGMKIILFRMIIIPILNMPLQIMIKRLRIFTVIYTIIS